MDEALAVLANVRSYGLTPNMYCYSAAAKSCLGRNRWRDAVALLEEARAEGIAMDATLYRTVLRCCWRARQWKSVLQLYRDMKDEGLEVGETSYQQLMGAVSGAGQSEVASEILREMVADGLPPSDATLAAFLRAYYERSDYDGGWAVLEGLRIWEGEAEGKGLRPGPGVFADLMALCVRREDWDEVLRLFERVTALGFKVPAAAQASAAIAAAEMVRWEDAMQLLADIEVSDIAWSKQWCRIPTGEEGGRLMCCSSHHWWQVELEGKGLQRVVETYRALLKLCSRRIDPERAQELLSRLKDLRISPDADCYHWTMDACAQAGGWVCRVLEDREVMRSGGSSVAGVGAESMYGVASTEQV